MTTRSIVFIDSRVVGYEALIAGLSTDTEWYLLDAEQDGIDQMQRILAGYSELDSVEIISHGSTATLYLGSTVLNSENFNSYQTQLQAIGSSLTETGDLLLYGSDIAQGDVGMHWIASLAQHTGADVAASDDRTGPGGDGLLEQSTGDIKASSLQYEVMKLINPLSAVGGIVITDFGSSNDYGRSITVEADGKILVVGSSAKNGNVDFALVRYNTDGTLDTSFSGDGKLTTDFGGWSRDYGYSVMVQADGKILVTGSSNYYGAGATISDQLALVRYNVDGTLDTSFSGDGKLTAYLGSPSWSGQSVTLQADGKILVAGYGTYNFDRFALIRYNSDGTLDTSFSGDGIVANDMIGQAYSVTVQTDGKILVAGQSYNGSNYDFALVRYYGNGMLDTSFSGDGMLTTDIGGSDDYGYSVSVQADGKILVAGASYAYGSNFALVRYNSDGTLDNSFSADGVIATDMSGKAYSVTVQSDGKILVAGVSYANFHDEFALVRYNSDGTLDTSFSGDGMLTTDLGWGDDQGYSVTVQADGKILVAGQSYDTNNGHNNFALVRYNSDGTLDSLFNKPNSPPFGSIRDGLQKSAQ